MYKARVVTNICIHVLIVRTLGHVLWSKFESSEANIGSLEAKFENT